jgi:hypothetical protein
MQFFLNIKEGAPVGHPTDRASVLALHPEGVPDSYQPFVPSAPPGEIGPYEKIDAQPSYVFNGDVWTHDYNRRAMTAEEKAEHIATIQASWAEHGYASWTWLENECRYVPPVQPPSDLGVFHWDETQQQWVEGPIPLPS